MTSKERMMMTAQGKEPDRVPRLLFVSRGWAWKQLYGPDSLMGFGRDSKKMAEVIVWMCRELGMDAADCGPDTHIYVEAIAEASGIPYPTTNWKDFVMSQPHRLYEGDPVKAPIYGNPLIKTMKDAEKLVPADPYKHSSLPAALETIALVKKELGNDWPIGGTLPAPRLLAGDLLGWTQTFIAMEKDLELWKRVEDIVIETAYEVAKAQIIAGVTGLGTTGSMPAYVGSKMYSEKPLWQHAEHPPELAERIWNEFRVGTSVHPCTVGPIDPGFEAWKKWLDHTPSFIIPEYGGADSVARAKKTLAPATIAGNIHPVDIMLHGTPDEVDAACKELIEKCAPGGRYILSPGCGISLDVPIENVKAMINAADKYGYYPIRHKG